MTFNLHTLFYCTAAIYLAALMLYLFKKRNAAFVALVAGAIAHAVYSVLRAKLTGIFIPLYLFDGVLVLPLLMAILVIVKRLFSKQEAKWESALFVLCFFALLAVLYPKGIIPPMPKKISAFAPLFFLTETLGHAAFYLAAWFALLTLARNEDPKVFHSFVIIGFLSFTIAQVVGAIWCFQGWAFTFKWSTRHLFSAAIWCYFAAYLHLKYLPLWNDRRRAWFVLAGFFVVLALSASSSIHEMFFPRVGG